LLTGDFTSLRRLFAKNAVDECNGDVSGAGPPFSQTTTMAAPPFAVFEGWAPRTSILVNHYSGRFAKY
jgi:hypothetical protein